MLPYPIFCGIIPQKDIPMRLSREIIKHIADTIVSNMRTKKLSKILQPDEAVSQRIAEFIIGDMVAEDRLNEEVKDLLASHEREISSGGADYRKLFELTKQKLARERGIIL